MKKLLMMIGAAADLTAKVLAAAIAAGAAIPMAANADVGTVDVNGVTWTVNTNATARTATLGNGTDACIATTTSIDASLIPWTFTVGEGDDAIEYTVTSIAAHAFEECSKLSGTLTIPNSVTSIGINAFRNCSMLTKLASFGGLTQIASRSFDYCSGLDNTECPDMSKLTYIESYNRFYFGGEARLTSISNSRGIGDNAFRYASITNVVFPRRAADIAGKQIFQYCTGLTGMYLPGPDSGTDRLLVRRADFASGCTSLKVFLAGPLTGLSDSFGKTDVSMFTSVSGCRMFVPYGTTWNEESDERKGLAAYEANNTIFYYGAGRELDMSFDNDRKLVTATPATAHALTNVLAAATTIKNVFGMDTRINVTNAIEIAAGSISAAELAGVTFDSLTFAVKTQAQLDTVLAAVPVETPLAIDPEGATENLTVLTENRKIYVMLPTNGTYKVRPGGIIIFVK